MSAYSIGVDLGGTNLRLAAIDKTGQILARVSEPANFNKGPEDVAVEIAKTVDRVREQIGRDSLAGVGIGVPGFVDIAAGVVVAAVNLPGFVGFPVRDRIQEHLGTPIILENDANAAALGEAWLGAGKGVKELILLTLGTGIGGGIIVDGKVLAWIPRNGRRVWPYYGHSRGKPLRLRESRLPGEACFGHCDHWNGADDAPGPRHQIRG